MKHTLPEDILIEYVKQYLKAKNFKKKNKRWTKDVGEFTISFLIQGSSYSKDDYYIRPGIFINELMPTELYYGHWTTTIEQTTPEDVIAKFEQWCSEWTNKSLIKERLIAFLEWEKRNPLENRRAGLTDYENDPVPAKEFFALVAVPRLSPVKYILDNF